jgi:acetyl-CoA C-acetyltransferase
MNTRRVAIVGGNRIPFARSNGTYAHASDQDMLTATLDGLVERARCSSTRATAT